jgi:gluconolactonase
MKLIFEKIFDTGGRPLGGLAWNGTKMLFADINDNSIRAYDPTSKELSIERKFTNRINGIVFGNDSQLYGCQEGSRRVIRMLADGTSTITSTHLGDSPHNHPNLITVDQKGHFWFTDCYHHLLASGPQVFPMLDHQSVLKLSLGPRPQSHWEIERVTFDTIRPRGVALSPDDKTLYVSDTTNELGKVREIRAYPIAADGSVGPFTVLHTFGQDYRGVHRGAEGLCIDQEGNLFAAAGGGIGPGPMIYVFAPIGSIKESYSLPEGLPLNCAFGDSQHDSLYVTTADGKLFRAIKTGSKGLIRF